MTSEFELVNLKLAHAERDVRDLSKAGNEFCRQLSIVISELNSGVDVTSEIVKGEINKAIDDYTNAVIALNLG